MTKEATQRPCADRADHVSVSLALVVGSITDRKTPKRLISNEERGHVSPRIHRSGMFSKADSLRTLERRQYPVLSTSPSVCSDWPQWLSRLRLGDFIMAQKRVAPNCGISEYSRNSCLFEKPAMSWDLGQFYWVYTVVEIYAKGQMGRFECAASGFPAALGVKSDVVWTGVSRCAAVW